MIPDQRASLACALSVIALACSAPPADERMVPSAPARDTFQPVGDVLQSHCGSLDCHGHIARNMRVYGGNGLRIGGVPGVGATTPEEYAATYDSIVVIDPEVLSAVVNEGGARPERWIVVSKGRGAEEHKGKTAMPAGGEGERCLISWLAAALDAVACTAAAEVLPPGAP